MSGVLCVALLATAPCALAVTRLVAPGGSDSGACTAAPCASLGYAYEQSAAADVVQVTPGVYGPQELPSGTKPVSFHGGRDTIVRTLDNHAANVTFDGINVDVNFDQDSGLENHGVDNVTFRNARVGNVTDDKGALITGANFTFDNVVFHNVKVTESSVHNECVYALDVPGMVVRNSTFYDCATMDLFFTYGYWWTPLPPPYGNITLENNVFGHSTMPEPDSWHYYGLYIGDTASDGGTVDGWTVRNNTFETDARISHAGSGGTRWVGNLGDWDCESGITYRRNVGKSCSESDRAVTPASSTATTTAAFGWVNPAAQDFRLAPGSPAIGAADPSDHPALDHDGLERDGRPDAGAHEFGAKPPGGAPGFTPIAGPKRARLLRLARMRTRLICRRPTRRCPKAAKLRISVSEPARVVVSLKRLRKGRKPKTAKRLRFNLATSRVVVIRARALRRGRYRAVIRATSAAGATSTPRVLRLRVR